METLVVACLTGAASSIATVVALRTDIAWIKLTLQKLDERITALEQESKAPHC
ncbi:hypothetical protein ABXV22_24465 [Vibrio rotiferianus]|uniref:hypothetical protein n=1 Tax=Vibrio rotiferianus TaxID=190895 RepID=UPI0003A39BA2|nr:hypothetical protein [Vibrio rotiferianus]PIB17215.1 hypothetical protein B853_07332 [Vibrio rotiferianus CAIM 577 = LMG 21460]